MEGDKENYDRDEIYSKVVRAGKRTYFFDVKSTRGNDLYLTLTESKKRFDDNGEARYEKHKVFLYKEDFDQFQEGFKDALDEIARLKETDERFIPSTEEKKDNEESDRTYTQTDWWLVDPGCQTNYVATVSIWTVESKDTSTQNLDCLSLILLE